MYISKLTAKGYRCFNEQFDITMAEGISVIVGENGAGKSAIINAIRQLFQDSEAGRYSVTEDDFASPFSATAATSSSFSISVEFDGLDNDEKIAFLPWKGNNEQAVLNLFAENREFRGRFKKVLWGGRSKGVQFDPEVLEHIQCIYLPPLRDAEAKLSNGRQSRLSKLLKTLNRKELDACKKSGDLHPLEKQVQDFNATLAADDKLAITTANTLITEQLTNAIGKHFGQKTTIQFAESNFQRIVESLTLLYFPDLSAGNIELFRGLSQNSLGYNNLLYIASILAELTFHEDDDSEPLFKLLLIEEPEAHLHPQLQIRLLEHLKSVAQNNRNVQVIVTTHSTVLASSVDLDSIIHLTKASQPVATSLRTCGLPPNSAQFINRWLDVTKSNLLFASGVILVEGIAEQILVPSLAKIVLSEVSDDIQTLDDLGVSTINLNGIYFRHFMQLYCNIKEKGDDGEKEDDEKEHEEKEPHSVPLRCAGLTDLDPPKKQRQTEVDENGNDKQVEKDFIPFDGNLLEGTNHALGIVESVNASSNARLYVSKYKTLEYDLAMEGNNAATMASVLSSLWPKPKSKASPVIKTLDKIGDKDWSDESSEMKSEAAFEILKRIDDDNIGKGIFAQVLGDKIEKEEIQFSVPEYIKCAVLWACSLESKESD